MKKITLTFKTKKGEDAYSKVEEEGNKKPYLERQVSRRIIKETLFSKNPLVIVFEIKIERLALAIDIKSLMISSLEKFGAVKDIDYIMEVE